MVTVETLIFDRRFWIKIRNTPNLSPQALGFSISTESTPFMEKMLDLKDIWGYGSDKPPRIDGIKSIEPSRKKAGKVMIAWSFTVVWSNDHLSLEILPTAEGDEDYNNPNRRSRRKDYDFINLVFEDDGTPRKLSYEEVEEYMPMILDEIASDLQRFFQGDPDDPDFDPWKRIEGNEPVMPHIMARFNRFD